MSKKSIFQENSDQGKDAACRINAHIHQRSRSRSDPGLMKLIAQGKDRHSKNRAEGPPQLPALPSISTEGTEEKQSQDKILRDVSGLSNESMKHGDVMLRVSWQQEAQERPDKQGCMIRRECSGGHGEDYAHPDKNGKPVSKKRMIHRLTCLSSLKDGLSFFQKGLRRLKMIFRFGKEG